MQNPTAVSHPLVIAETSIRQDSEGRYCLNDLHRAAGGEEKHAPNRFVRTDGCKSLVLLQTPLLASAPLVTNNGGNNQGTFVVKQLVYAYAMWISPEFHLRVINTFDAVVTGQLQPAPVASVLAPAKEYRALYGIARLIGLDKNHAVLSANTAVRKMTGVDMLGMLGTTHLVSENPDPHFTPTELAGRLGKSAQWLNRKLAEVGLQENKNGHWCATDNGKKHAVLLDTSKRHTNGTPILQLRWRDSVMGLLGGAA